MNVKKLKRKCSVRGCKSTESYSITNVREHGNTVIICKECVKAALEAMEVYIAVKAVPKAEKSLFFSDALIPPTPTVAIASDTGGKEDSPDAPQNSKDETVSANDGENPPSEPQYICEKCGKVCSSQSGLTSHKKACDTK